MEQPTQLAVASTSSIAGVEVIATKNGKVVFINKTAGSIALNVGMGGVAPNGMFKAWQTDAGRPLEMPAQTSNGTVYQAGKFTIELPPTTVSSIEI